MKRHFVDTSYLIALVSEHDPYHEKALEIQEELLGSAYLSTSLIQTEFLNFFCEAGRFWRGFAVSVSKEFEASPRTVVTQMTLPLFKEARGLYNKRLDKGYSLTDCFSMVVMKHHDINLALTTDKHFIQEGFRALLLE
ncbi:MAG: PIN domain-containing protein [Flavobacteriales bacterium]|nr:PIN domain-containing protein [Flavobacteriales bacterium]